MKRLMGIILLLVINAAAAEPRNTPQLNAPQPNTPQANNAYSSGFGFDNQLYFLQGWGVASTVGPLTNRPWVGAAAGVGSCMLWRAVHDQGYANDSMFSSNRVAFCALGSAVGYATTKWVFHVHRNKH